jgi:mRNA deadenylase 3'-5' endonuclease subunit Ccr4
MPPVGPLAQVRASSLLELHSDGVAVRLASLPHRVRALVEHVLTEPSRELEEQACSSSGGYLPLATLAALEPVRALLPPHTPLAAIAAALRPSTIVELDAPHADAAASGVRRIGAAKMEVDDSASEAGSDLGLSYLEAEVDEPRAATPAPAAATAATAATTATTAAATAAVPRYAFLPARPFPPGKGFSLITFNILADYLARTDTHAYCPWHLRRWPHRVARIVRGLQKASSDLVCLQEVQGVAQPSSEPERRHNHYQQLHDLLADSGYSIASLALRCDSDGRVKPHRSLGNAVFYKAASFERAPGAWRGRVNLAQELAARCSSPAQLARYVYGKEQSAAWTRLRHRVSGRCVCVASCHIACDFLNPDAQVAQVHALLSRLESSVVQPGDALVLAGDFNSLPESGVRELCVNGVLPLSHEHAHAPDAKLRPPLTSLPARAGAASSTVRPSGYAHGLHLASAYESVDGHEPQLTNRTPDFGPSSPRLCMPTLLPRSALESTERVLTGRRVARTAEGCLDYIFYSSALLTPTRVLPTPTAAQAASEGGGLPSTLVPSDHVPIGASFEFT